MIKTAFCVSYDWQMLKHSLPRVYNDSDVICLGLDVNRRTWAGTPFEFNDEEFFSFVKSVDRSNKIVVYEDEFSLPNQNSRQNCNRHRMMMAEKMGKGGWHLQVDADEYFLDFKSFVLYLKSIYVNPTGNEKPINVCANWIPLIKKTTKGYLFVDFEDSLPETVPIATNCPNYQRARHNGYFNILSPHYIVHETWARSEDALWFKINNWGHASEELSEKQKRLSYFNLWKSLDEFNYKYIRNFHPASSHTWPALEHINANSIGELLERLPTPKFPYSALQLNISNNRNYARLKSIWKKLFNN